MRARHARWRTPRRRAAYLLLKSVLSVAIGLSYLLPDPSAGTAQTLAFLVNMGVPVQLAGVPWVLAGLLGLVGARMPTGREGWAFATLAAVSAGWAILYTWAWLTGESPRGYFLAVVFAMLAGATFLVSGMVDVDEVSSPPRQLSAGKESP